MRGVGTIALLCAIGVCGLAGARPALARQNQMASVPKRCEPNTVIPVEPKIIVDGVRFLGESHPPNLSRDQMIALIGRSAAQSKTRRFERVWMAVRGAWQRDGYFLAVAQVTPHVLASGPGWRKVSFTVRVDPGPRYKIGSIRVMSYNARRKLVFSENRLRKMVPLGWGDVANPEKIHGAIEQIAQLYARHGYLDFTAVPVFHIDNQHDRVSFVLELDQGRQYRIGEVKALGLPPLLEKALHKAFLHGEVFDASSVARFCRKEKWVLLPPLELAAEHVERNQKDGTVSVLLDFRRCANIPPPGATTASSLD